MRAAHLRGLSTGAALAGAVLGTMLISAAIRAVRPASPKQGMLGTLAMYLALAAAGAAIAYSWKRTKEELVADEMADMPRITLPWGAIPVGVH